jgi:hypothetical protein
MNVDRTNSPTLEHVLNEIVASPTPPDAKTLRDWTTKYPEYADAIVELISDWVEMELTQPEPEATDEDVDVVVNRTMSRVQMILDADGRSRALIDLATDIRAAGHDAVSFQRSAGIDQSILDCLIARLVSPKTIPAQLVRAVAIALNRSVGQVRDYLRLPPLAAAAYKSRSRPVSMVSDFTDLVRFSQLSESEKTQWLAEQPDPELQD